MAATQAYYGYNAIGASADALLAGAKLGAKLVLPSALLITSVSIYGQCNLSQVDQLSVAIHDDNSGVPGKMVATGASDTAIDTYYGIASWKSIACYLWVPAAVTLWAVIWSNDNSGGTGDFQISYDSGSNTFSAGSAAFHADSSYGGATLASTGRSYSIRVNTLA